MLFQICEIKKDEIRFKKYIFLLDMFLIVGGRVPVTGMLAGMNLSKPGINLSKPGINLSKPGKKHRNHVIMFYNPPPRMFPSLDLPSEYRIQHGAIGLLYVTSSYSIWIFCKGVSGFATDCPCDVWCRGLTICLLHVGPPFGNRFLNTSWAVGLTY